MLNFCAATNFLRRNKSNYCPHRDLGEGRVLGRSSASMRRRLRINPTKEFFLMLARLSALFHAIISLFCNISYMWLQYNVIMTFDRIERLKKPGNLFHDRDSWVLFFSLYCPFLSTTFLNGEFSISQTPRSVWILQKKFGATCFH